MIKSIYNVIWVDAIGNASYVTNFPGESNIYLSEDKKQGVEFPFTDEEIVCNGKLQKIVSIYKSCYKDVDGTFGVLFNRFEECKA